MPYLVHLTARAERDLVRLYAEIGAEKSSHGLRWYRGLKDAILSLGAFPDRCPVAPESKRLRHLLYGHKPHIYRVIYQVLGDRRHVEVLHIRHGARRKLTRSILE